MDRLCASCLDCYISLPDYRMLILDYAGRGRCIFCRKKTDLYTVCRKGIEKMEIIKIEKAQMLSEESNVVQMADYDDQAALRLLETEKQKERRERKLRRDAALSTAGATILLAGAFLAGFLVGWAL